MKLSSGAGSNPAPGAMVRSHSLAECTRLESATAETRSGCSNHLLTVCPRDREAEGNGLLHRTVERRRRFDSFRGRLDAWPSPDDGAWLKTRSHRQHRRFESCRIHLGEWFSLADYAGFRTPSCRPHRRFESSLTHGSVGNWEPRRVEIPCLSALCRFDSDRSHQSI